MTVCRFCGASPAPAMVWDRRMALPACRDCHAGLTGRRYQRAPVLSSGGLRDRAAAADETEIVFVRTAPVLPSEDPLTEPSSDAEPEDGSDVELPQPAETAEALVAKIATLQRLGASAAVLAEYQARLARLI